MDLPVIGKFMHLTKWEERRLKHCNLSTIPKKGTQNQAP